jgi:hypothetical protein
MLVLHVGPHKTATTWLQRNFHFNVKALQRAGWYYPQTGERVRVAHHDLSDNAAEIFDDNSAKVREFRKIAARAEAGRFDILLSSEGFRNWKLEHLEKLREIVAPHEIRVVYCLRDPVSLLYSFWAQQVKTGGAESLPAYHRRQRKKGGKSKVFNPLREITKFDRFSRGQLTILLYDEIRRGQRDIFDVFIEDILRLKALPHVGGGLANEREPIEMTEFMRLMLLRTAGWKGRAQVNIGRVFRYMLTDAKRAEITRAVAAARPAADRVLTVSREFRFLTMVDRRIMERHRSQLLPEPQGERLFLTGSEDFVYLDKKVLEADPGVSHLLRTLTRRFRPRGPNMLIANAARFWLIQWRRLIKLFR